MRQAHHPGLLIITGSLFVFGPMPARAADPGADRLRICIARTLPEKVVTIGFTPTITVNIPRYQTDTSWFQHVKDLFWRIRFPAEARLRQAPDRPDITTQIYGMILYPQMVWAAPVDAELRRMLGKPAAAETAPSSDCLQYAELSPASVSDGQILIQVVSPTFAPKWQPPRSGDCEDEAPVRRSTRTPELDFDNFKACHYAAASLGMVHSESIRYFGPDATYPPLSCPVQKEPVSCTMNLNRDGWPVYVSFRKTLIREWRTIAEATISFLDKATVSRDDITVAKIDRRP